MPHGLDGLLIDIAGVLVDRSGPIAGALEALVRLRSAGVPFRLLTNLSRLSPEEISRRLEGCGFSVDSDEIWNPPRLVSQRLSRRPAGFAAHTLLVVAPESLGLEATRERPDPDVAPEIIVIGDPGAEPDPSDVQSIRRGVSGGSEIWLLARAPDPPILGLEPVPGLERLLEAIAGASDRVRLVGKPDPGAFREARRDLGLPDEAVVAMVGDDPAVDLAGAAMAGLKTVLVVSGGLAAEGIEGAPCRPDYVADDLGAFVHRWLKIR